MRDFAITATRCPHHEQSDAIENAYTLEPLFELRFPRVFAGQQVAVKKTFKIGEVDTMNLEIDAPFPAIPTDHDVVYTQHAYARIRPGGLGVGAGERTVKACTIVQRSEA